MIADRPATLEGDFELGREIHHESYRDVVVRQFGVWDQEKQDKFFEEGWARAPQRFILLDGAVVGVVSEEELSDHIFIHEIQIRVQFQGRGIGSHVMGDVLARARQAGKKVKLKVLLANHAKRLYERMGFVVCDQGSTHYHMEWAG